MSKKVYAIAYGQDPKTEKPVNNLVVNTWDECKRYIDGVKSAKYKSFTDPGKVEEYFNINSKSTKLTDDNIPDLTKGIFAFVDGSYNSELNKVGGGSILLINGIIHMCTSMDLDTLGISNFKQLNQTGGELVGAIVAINTIRKSEYNLLTIVHDYEGVASHGLGTWKRESDFARKYHQIVQDAIKENNDIRFLQINSHQSPNPESLTENELLYYVLNGIADDLAKREISVTQTGEVTKLLKYITIKVNNVNTRKMLISLGYDENKLKLV